MTVDGCEKLFLNELLKKEEMEICLFGSTITLKASQPSTQLFFSTPVYSGGNYIPKSVRACLEKHAHFEREFSIQGKLFIDEENFKIFLWCEENLDHAKHHFVARVEEFALLALEWRNYLDEHDKKDLVYIRAS